MGKTIYNAKQQDGLVKKARAGDENATSALYAQSYDDLCFFARKYRCSRAGFDDLLSEAKIGFMRALMGRGEGYSDYDPKNRCTFRSYALIWIRRYTQWYCMVSSRLIEVPSNATQLLAKACRYSEECAKLGEDLPDANKIAAHFDVKVRVAEAILRSMRWVQSFDAPIELREGSGSIHEVISGSNVDIDYKEGRDKSVERDFMAEDFLRQCIMRLKPEYADIITRYYGLDADPQTLMQISKDLGCSRDNIGQKRIRAVADLKNIANGITYADRSRYLSYIHDRDAAGPEGQYLEVSLSAGRG
jgi:RNA polymerase sigma factor (sigma-70 family)